MSKRDKDSWHWANDQREEEIHFTPFFLSLSLSLFLVVLYVFFFSFLSNLERWIKVYAKASCYQWLIFKTTCGDAAAQHTRWTLDDRWLWCLYMFLCELLRVVIFLFNHHEFSRRCCDSAVVQAFIFFCFRAVLPSLSDVKNTFLLFHSWNFTKFFQKQ